MKKLGILLFVLTNIYICHAQKYYRYDASGNRISRSIDINYEGPVESSASIYDGINDKLSEDNKPEKEFSDVLGNKDIKLYPNPTMGELVVQIIGAESGETVQLKVFDLGGKLVFKKKNAKEFTRIDITKQPAGTYILHLISGETSIQWKIIKH